MPTLHKSKIDDYAFDYLKNYYTQRHQAQDVFVFMDEKAKNGATADGLFTYCKADEDYSFVATLNTKSSDKLAALLTKFKKGNFLKVCYALTLLAVAAVAPVTFLFTENPIVTGILSLITVPLAYIACMLGHRFFCRRQLLNLVSTLKRLPANQKWIGISISSQAFRNNRLADSFLDICRQRGIGVMTVGKRSKVVLMLEPKTVTRRHGDFLSFYKSEMNIRKEALGDRIMRVA